MNFVEEKNKNTKIKSDIIVHNICHFLESTKKASEQIKIVFYGKFDKRDSVICWITRKYSELNKNNCLSVWIIYTEALIPYSYYNNFNNLKFVHWNNYNLGFNDEVLTGCRMNDLEDLP